MKKNFLKKFYQNQEKIRIMKEKKAQIWVETVIYTLIGLIIIGIVLAVATPAIARYKDEMIIEQTITVLNELDNKILEIRDMGAANKRIIPELRIKKGTLIIDSSEDKISYILEESRLEYSEPETEVKQGGIIIKTEKRGRKYDISLMLNYTDKDIDLTCDDEDKKKILQEASTPYKLSIENNGTTAENKIQINIKEIS